MRYLSAVARTLVVALLIGALGAPEASANEVRAIVFPVEGTVRYANDFGDPRSGGRSHAGNDLFGNKLQRVIAAADGRVSYLRTDSGGTSGNMLTITDADGWQYRYIHLNNDTPGTDDGANPIDWAFVPGMVSGARVVAGAAIGYLGDSGNAEATPPHLHFEIIRPDGVTINPFFSLGAARRVAPPAGRAVGVNPNGGYYVLTAQGAVHAFGAPHFGQPYFPFDIARSIAVMPDGLGYVVLDGWGGVHRFGSAATGAMAVIGNPYWPGWDIARAVAITSSGEGLAVLDGWGGIHSFGDAPRFKPAYWPGWDIARGFAFTATEEGVYVLDGWGGVHADGDGEMTGSPYWPGWDIARGIVAAPTGTGYAVFDGWGGVHPFGDAPPPLSTSWAQADRWKAFASNGRRYYGVRHDGMSLRW